MLNLSQLLRVPHVDNNLRFDISPDKQRIIFSWNKTGKWELWESGVQEQTQTATCLTSKVEGNKFSPVFSPDGAMFAYALDIDGSESYHIVIHDLNTNISKDLTPQIAYAHQPNITWSPDCKMLAVLSDKHGQFALHLLPIDGTAGRMIKNVFHPCWDAKWSPDGQWIAIEAESTGSEHSIYVMPVNRPHKAKKVATTRINLNAQQPAWSPDSKFLAFSGEHNEWHDIGLFNVETQEITWVNESIGDDTQPAWSRSGELIGWVHAEGAKTCFQSRTEPCRSVKDRSGVIHQKKIGDGVHYFPQFTSEGVVILYEDTNHPCDLWKINLEDDSAQPLTNSLPDDLHDAEFIQPEEIYYKSKDGTQVPALLYRAKDSTRAVINIHGGPNWLYQFLWEPMMSHMASRGWTVLAPNYRGSSGYGKKWQNASRYDMGGVDTDDCAAGVDYLIENNLADKDKIAITGRSHGGFITMSCMTRYPELFAIGSAVVPFLNWLKSHKNSREDLQHWNIENMGDPEENQELWISHSPYFFLDKINAPVQLICGGNDPRCPASDSIDAHRKLVDLGKEVEFHLYKDEGHTFLNIENIIDAEEKRVEFLAGVLGK